MQSIHTKRNVIEHTIFQDMEEAEMISMPHSGLYETAFHFMIDFDSSKQYTVGKSTYSREFTSDNGAAKWTIEVFKNGFNNKSEGFITMRLHLLSRPLLRVCAKFFILNQKTNLVEYVKKASYYLDDYATLEADNWIPHVTLIEVGDAIGLTADRKINVGARIEYFSACGSNLENVFPSTTLQKDLLKLFRLRRESGDITLVGTNAEVKAHSAILSARSDYFRQKFRKPVDKIARLFGIEKVHIDLNGGLLWEFVRFMYCDDMSL